jgi:hypothetical protein
MRQTDEKLNLRQDVKVCHNEGIQGMEMILGAVMIVTTASWQLWRG